MRLFRFVCLGLIVLCCALGAAPAQAVTFPDLSGRIVDQAHVLQPQSLAALEQRLAQFEQQTGQQIVVVTLPSLNGETVEDYTYQLGRHWGIGQKGKNNGAIILVVPSERVARIEAGYGLEGDLTDATSSLVINNIMIPFFKNGDFETGLVQGTLAVMQIVQGDAQSVPALQRQPGKDISLMNVLMILFLIAWIVLRRRGGRRSSGLAPFILGSLLGGGRGGGFGGGDGFRGGGGSFGGGGASGRW